MRIKFEQLSKKDKNFRIVNLCLMGAVLAAIIGIMIYYYCIGDPYNRVSAGYVMAAFSVVPLLIELIFRTRLPNVVFFGAEIYLIITGVWGSLLCGYMNIWWLDIVIHTLMGYIFAMMGLFVISRITKYNKLSVWAVALFCFVFSLGIELVWELGEWSMDNLFGQTAQGEPYGNAGAPLVTDTMQDLLCNFSGSLAFTIHFLIGKLTKLKVGIKTIEQELAIKRIRPKNFKTDIQISLLKQERILKKNKIYLSGKKFIPISFD